jgi:hypothetical protein
MVGVDPEYAGQGIKKPFNYISFMPGKQKKKQWPYILQSL